MSNLPVVFNFGTQSIRTIDKDGEVWFVASDVCAVLEVSNPTQAVQRLDDDERSMLNIGRQGEVHIINESGLFSLVLSSRKAEAKSFKRWVTHDVLPTIRKTGKYEGGGGGPAIQQPTAAPVPLLPGPRRIKSWDDLSFIKRDAEGKLLSWFMPSRTDSWHEHYGIGETWFEEVVQLAKANPSRAFDAMRFAAKTACMRYGEYGHSDGFFERMARYAFAGMQANEGTPKMPFKTPELGIPPREGYDFWLSRAQEPLSAAEMEGIERQALADSTDCILECIRTRKAELIAQRRA